MSASAIRTVIRPALAFVLVSPLISFGINSAFTEAAMSQEPTVAAPQSAHPTTQEAASAPAPPNTFQGEAVTSVGGAPSPEQRALEEIIAILKKPQERQQKDNWDRFAALSTFISTVIIALIGLYFTQSYNRAEANRRELQELRQNQINELDVVAKFMPYLTGQDETAKVTAITTIRALAGVRLATVMAELHPSAGTAQGLEVIAQSTRNTPEERALAETTANKIYETLAGVTVLFATDRQMSSSTPPSYDQSRGELSFGRGLVTVPNAHRLGAVERPSLWRFEFSVDPNRHLVLQELAAIETSVFFDGLANILAASASRDVLVFIPGYNVNFESAILRLGQLSYDLALSSPAVLFSWPSQASSTAYLVDQANAAYAVPDLVSFLRDLAKIPHIGRINVLAHGLGCRLAIDSILSLQRADASSTLAKNLILVSPDVDRDLLLANTAKLEGAVDRLTIYVSRNDSVFKLATKVAGSPRAGDASAGVVVFPSADTIDATGKDSSLLGYGPDSVLPDIYWILRDGSPPDRRSSLRQAAAGGKTYWIYD